MHNSINNLIKIQKQIKSKIISIESNRITPNIIAVSKTFPINDIIPLIDSGHIHFGENKVQEAVEKWTDIKKDNKTIKLHLIGKLQTNKVKFAVKIFDFIHSLDNEKLAKKIADEQIKQNKILKIFIQINIGDEEQKNGINKDNVIKLYEYCNNLNLNVVGIMCIPPKNNISFSYFLEMNKINKELGLVELSMGMSDDYLTAIENNATYLRIGSKIFGKRY
jgi:PLP dependent protein